MTLDHDALREFATGYAFGTLDAPERAAFEEHVRTCVECQQDVRDALRLAEGLGQSVEPQALPSDLRERVLRAATSWGRDTLPFVAPPARTTTRTGAGRVAPWLALAASLAALVAGTAAWTEHRRALDALADAALARQQAAAAERALMTLQANVTETRRAVQILSASDVDRVDLKGQAAAPRAAGRAFWSASRGLMFTATDLPPLPQGRIYQLWYVTGAAPVSAGLITPDASGQVNTIIAPSAPVRPRAFALTIEPEGGVPAPTGAMYLVGSF